MTDFLLQGPNLPFVVAIAVMLAIALLEVISMVMGFGLGGAIDGMLPSIKIEGDFGTPHGNVSADVPHHAETPLFAKALVWMGVGRVPVLILLVLFLTIFGITGLIVQTVAQSITGYLLPSLLAVPIAMVATIPAMRHSSRAVAKIIPKDETTAVSEASFVGRVATIVLGTAKQGTPAQAKLHDEHRQTHYIMVEPDLDSEEFTAGTAVLLVRRVGRTFRGIRNRNEALLDDDQSQGDNQNTGAKSH